MTAGALCSGSKSPASKCSSPEQPTSTSDPTCSTKIRLRGRGGRTEPGGAESDPAAIGSAGGGSEDVEKDHRPTNRGQPTASDGLGGSIESELTFYHNSPQSVIVAHHEVTSSAMSLGCWNPAEQQIHDLCRSPCCPLVCRYVIPLTHCHQTTTYPSCLNVVQLYLSIYFHNFFLTSSNPFD